MEIEKIKEERHALLERMRDSLQEELVAAEIVEPEKENEPEILTAVLSGIGEAGEMEGAYGEFFFVPVVSGEDAIQHFSAVITLLDDLDREKLPMLFEAMSYINFSQPCGSYCVDRDAAYLCYKMTVPLPSELSGDALFEEMNICMANAATAADLYADLLIRIASGEGSLDEIPPSAE
ncbi:MAG: hypothetical protein K6F35_09710 [Lachnospiraceae bacterium]|nr:hypothetical protein [Lachnospiraceae bacterium]